MTHFNFKTLKKCNKVLYGISGMGEIVMYSSLFT